MWLWKTDMCWVSTGSSQLFPEQIHFTAGWLTWTAMVLDFNLILNVQCRDPVWPIEVGSLTCNYQFLIPFLELYTCYQCCTWYFNCLKRYLGGFFLLNREKKLPDESIMNEGTVICASVLEITSCWDMRGSVTWLTATAAETVLLITQLLFTHMQFALSCRVIKVHTVKSNWLNVPQVISAVWTPGKTGLFALDQLSILNSSLPILQEEWIHCFYVPKNKSSDSRAPSLFFPAFIYML